MKGAMGLVVALGLGILGAFCNWFYLAQKSRDLEKVEFIAISDQRLINAGDVFQESDFVPVAIPALNVGKLGLSAYKYSERQTIVGMAAPRAYEPGEILLRLDVRTPPPMDVKRLLVENERVMWIPVDNRTFVAPLVNAGDLVSFIVPKLSGPTPARVDPDELAGGPTEILGPYRILALGNRLGSAEVMKAAGLAPAQENVMAVAVKVVDGKLDENGRKLSDLLRLTNFQQVQVLLHPDPAKAKRE